MRKSFGENLRAYNEVAKDQLRENLTAEQQSQLKAVLDWHIQKAVERRETSPETQEKIFQIQKKKQEIMRRLKVDIVNLDNPDFVPERKMENGEFVDRRIVCDNGKYFWRGAKEGKPNIEVTLGDIMTDGEWGIAYYLDPASVPRNIRKRYLLEQAKLDLQRSLDEQIVADETGSTGTDEWKRGAYVRAWEERDSGRPGIVAERIVRTLFAKLVYDHNSSFELTEGDIFQDVEKKIDFILRRKQYYRGVGVAQTGEGKEIGVQFTLRNDQYTLRKKEHQLGNARTHLSPEDRIKDIILVSVPVGLNLGQLYDEFKKRPWCGGPEKYLPSEIKQTFVRKILQGMVPEEEINRLVAAVEKK